MSVNFEIQYNFDPLNANYALLDTNFDAITNVAEALARTHPLLYEYASIINPPQAVNVNAEHTFTALDISRLIALTKISVNDGLDGINCCGLCLCEVAVVDNETIALEVTPEKSSGGGVFWLALLAQFTVLITLNKLTHAELILDGFHQDFFKLIAFFG
jgi:hypothetical protein